MSLDNILKYGMCIPAPQFPLIAHFVKWFITSDDIKISPAYMILDGQKYTGGLLMSYMAQLNDLLMLKPVSGLIATTITVAGKEFTIFVEVYEHLAKLSFRKDE